MIGQLKRLVGHLKLQDDFGSLILPLHGHPPFLTIFHKLLSTLTLRNGGHHFHPMTMTE